MIKTIYAGPKVGFYSDSGNLARMVKQYDGNFIHHDQSASKRYDSFEVDHYIFQARGATLVYTRNGLKQTAVVRAFGTEDAISEVEKIIAKTEKEHGLSRKEPVPYRSYYVSE